MVARLLWFGCAVSVLALGSQGCNTCHQRFCSQGCPPPVSSGCVSPPQSPLLSPHTLAPSPVWPPPAPVVVPPAPVPVPLPPLPPEPGGGTIHGYPPAPVPVPAPPPLLSQAGARSTAIRRRPCRSRHRRLSQPGARSTATHRLPPMAACPPRPQTAILCGGPLSRASPVFD